MRYFIKNNRKEQSNFMYYTTSLTRQRIRIVIRKVLGTKRCYKSQNFIATFVSSRNFHSGYRHIHGDYDSWHSWHADDKALGLPFYSTLELEWPRFRLRLADILWSGAIASSESILSSTTYLLHKIWNINNSFDQVCNLTSERYYFIYNISIE